VSQWIYLTRIFECDRSELTRWFLTIKNWWLQCSLPIQTSFLVLLVKIIDLTTLSKNFLLLFCISVYRRKTSDRKFQIQKRLMELQNMILRFSRICRNYVNQHVPVSNQNSSFVFEQSFGADDVFEHVTSNVSVHRWQRVVQVVKVAVVVDGPKNASVQF
jgi:hypothetical protein